ncbi:hypothetical protein FXO38_35933 [Capsicum annuum]|nr:hypothetical protein FXO37_36339 [Capsicum annuum]KAF3613979.1 hypothetical protein FXO38_35933 [Capsicum annuum]
MPLVIGEEDESEENNEEFEEIPMEKERFDGDGDSKRVFEVEPAELHKDSNDPDDSGDEDEDEEESLSLMVREEEMNGEFEDISIDEGLHSSLLLRPSETAAPPYLHPRRHLHLQNLYSTQ